MANDLLTGGQDTYDASSIEVLEGLEPVRQRPGMYIGGTDERALHHMVAEILDNAMDEAVAGHANRIEVELHPDHSVTVRDNGRGIPVDPHPKFPEKSALEVILCTLHSGGKFSGKAYQTSGGLHGVGSSVVNALSDSMVVQVAKNKELYEQRFSRGLPLGPVQKIGAAPNRRGTTTSSSPNACSRWRAPRPTCSPASRFAGNRRLTTAKPPPRPASTSLAGWPITSRKASVARAPIPRAAFTARSSSARSSMSRATSNGRSTGRPRAMVSSSPIATPCRRRRAAPMWPGSGRRS